MEKKLYRSKTNRIIAGVCGGIGEYLDVDPVLIRFLFLVLTIFGGSGIVMYLIAIVIIPEDGISTETITQTAHKVEDAARDAAGKIKEAVTKAEWSNRAEFVLGMVLLLFGAVLLIQLFAGIFNLFYLWPLVLIVAGLIILIKR